MRLFIAVNFDNDMRLQLLALRDELHSRSECGNFVLPENLHLTLVFLGECSEDQVERIKRAVGFSEFEPFDIQIDRLGRFKRSDGDLWWAGIRDNRELNEMQHRLSDNLIQEGFRLDKRRFNPHITLGRKVIVDIVPRRIETFGQTVSRIDLMKSERIDGVLTYTMLQ